MWVRKRIEITFGEILRGLFSSCLPANRDRLLAEIDHSFAPHQSFVCLSIRSGLDLLLGITNWPVGSEIILSGLTIPDMPRIVRKHRFEPVGVDVDIDSLAPKVDSLRALITPRTKAIVVAHLFGGKVDLDAIAALAQEHGLMLIEDCAQVYVGNHYVGHPGADISMFSFGPIKTNTALGGAVFVVRSKALLQRLNDAHQKLPVNSRWSFVKRLGKYALVRFISTRLLSGMIAFTMRCVGSDHDHLATKMARGFPGPRFFDKIRQQPSTPLLGLLAKKLQTFDAGLVGQRARRGLRATGMLQPRVDVLGSKMIEPTFWVFPILATERTALVQRLWKLGFDATTRSSLVPVNRVLDDSGKYSTERLPSDANLPNCHFLLQNMVILPFDLNIPQGKLDAMIQTILESNSNRPNRANAPSQPHEPLTAGKDSARA